MKLNDINCERTELVFEGGQTGINRWGPANDVSYEKMLDEIMLNELSVDKLKKYQVAAHDPGNLKHRPLRKIVKTARGADRADDKVRAKTGDRRPKKQNTYEDRLQDYL